MWTRFVQIKVETHVVYATCSCFMFSSLDNVYLHTTYTHTCIPGHTRFYTHTHIHTYAHVWQWSGSVSDLEYDNRCWLYAWEHLLGGLLVLRRYYTSVCSLCSSANHILMFLIISLCWTFDIWVLEYDDRCLLYAWKHIVSGCACLSSILDLCVHSEVASCLGAVVVGVCVADNSSLY